MKKSKLPNFPSLTNLHHESCSKEKLTTKIRDFWPTLDSSREARIKFFSTLQVMESSASPPVPSIRIHRSALSFLDRAFRLANTQKDGHI